MSQSSSRVKSSYNFRNNQTQKRADKSQKTYKRLQQWKAALDVLRAELKAGIDYSQK